ncbi:MAG: ATP-binding protein [Acidimicrobiia bacterium]
MELHERASHRQHPDLTDPAWIEILPDAVCIMDADFTVVSLRQGMTDLDDCFHVGDHDELSKALAQCREIPGRAVTVPARYLDGIHGWRQGVASVVDWTSNHLMNALVIRWRPTRNSDRSTLSPDVLKAMAEQSREGIWVCDPHGRTRYANPAAAHLCSHDHAHLQVVEVQSVFDARSAELLLGHKGVSEPIVAEVTGPDGTSRTIRAWSSVVPAGTGDPLGIVVHLAPHITLPAPPSEAAWPVSIQIDESRESEVVAFEAGDASTAEAISHLIADTIDDGPQAVESDHAMTVRALSDALPVGIFEIDGEMRLASSNPAWREAVGPFANDEPFGWLGKVHPDDRSGVDHALVRPRVDEWFHERYRVCHDIDEWKWVETKVVAIGDGSRHAGICADITASVAIEERISEARDAAIETSRMKSDFLANMSHEIRTPLNGVIGMATLLLDTPLNRDQRDRVLTLRSAGEHLLVLVNDILDFSKVETGKVELEQVEFDLLPVISQVVSLYSSAGFDKGVRLRVDTDAALPRSVIGDPSRLRQILSNLVGNAVKFTEQGSVTMRVTAEGKRSTIVRFEVIDTGLGISPEAQERIFEPFMQADTSTTRRFGGTGLGLPISRRLVEAMGGMLSVDSKMGKGSTFWFTIPFADPAETDAPRIEPDPTSTVESIVEAINASGPRGRVLLVEDNPINQKVALGFLSHLGWEADVANDGSEGSEAAINGTYALVLMDCQMPHMDGYEATARIRAHERKHGGHVPIIALTAGAMPGDRERCIDAGMDDYLSKPIDVGRLDATMRQWARSVEQSIEPNGTDDASESVESSTPSSPIAADGTDVERLDPVIVDQLRSITTTTGTLLDEALEQFRSDLETRVDDVLMASAEGDWPRMSRAAHALKGMSAAVGANRLASVADALQRAGKADVPEPIVIDELVNRLRQAVVAARAAVTEELTRSTATVAPGAAR